MNAAATTAIRVEDALGLALNWLVSKAEGYQAVYTNGSISPVFKQCEAVVSLDTLEYSTNPSQAYPIIVREKIGTAFSGGQWVGFYMKDELDECDWDFKLSMYGPTPLVAAMRCFVASKLGDEIDMPKELL